MSDKVKLTYIPYSNVDKGFYESIVEISDYNDGIINPFILYNKELDINVENLDSIINKYTEYIDETEPWVLGKEGNTDRLSTVMYNLIESLRIITILIRPFITETSDKIKVQIGLEDTKWENARIFGLTKPGTKVKKTENLFPRLDINKEAKRLTEENKKLMDERKKAKESAKVEEVKEENLITIDDFDKVELKIGTIVEADLHPKADKLLVFQVKIGDETRQIVSGIKKWYSPSDLVGKDVVVCTNLKPVKLRGIESHGMLLAADKDDKLSLLTTISEVGNGALIS